MVLVTFSGNASQLNNDYIASDSDHSINYRGKKTSSNHDHDNFDL